MEKGQIQWDYLFSTQGCKRGFQGSLMIWKFTLGEIGKRFNSFWRCHWMGTVWNHKNAPEIIQVLCNQYWGQWIILKYRKEVPPARKWSHWVHGRPDFKINVKPLPKLNSKLFYMRIKLYGILASLVAMRVEKYDRGCNCGCGTIAQF